MRRNLRFKAAPITDPLNDARHERGAVEHAHLTRHADIRIHQGVVVGDHVFVGGIWRDGVLEGVGGALEEEAPEGSVDEVEEGDDAEGAVWWG